MLRRAALLAGVSLCACATIAPGEGGVVWSASDGVQNEPLGEGKHFIGFFSTVDVFDLRAQERNEDLVGLTADGSPVEAGASVVTFHVRAADLPAIDRELGKHYYSKLVSPLVHAVARRVLAGFRAVQLDTPGIRAAQERMKEVLARELVPLHIVLDNVVFRRIIPLSNRAYTAVLQTGQAEQQALAAPSLLAVARQRADERRALARGIAQSYELVRPTLTEQSLADADRRAWDELLQSPRTTVLVRPSDPEPILLEQSP